MTDPQWEKAKHLFGAALELDPAERDAFLRHECQGAPDLLEEVRSLLAWDAGSSTFLEAPVARVADLPSAAGASLVGQSVGSWRILNVIGSGGMGVVYRAERADAAFARQAAIKVLRAGIDSSVFLDRFRRERETLAGLDHPGIARLMDGGTTPDGQPYFVMELVDGVPIDEFCDLHRLAIDRRLEMFRAVCDAVQCAHERLVVHRDLKPDNILVAKDGRPKLLDFGVAKILEPGVPDDADEAMRATWLMTPHFASPEQLRGRAITTASDVYSLGVLLYLLLTGTHPYNPDVSTPAEIRDALQRPVWVSPSRRALTGDGAAERAALRATTPRRLFRRLAGDLDAIVERSLGVELKARYSSVEQLLHDLERERAAQPVAARGRRPGYLLRTFVRRNAVALAISTAMVLAAAAGVAAILRQSAAAARARADAERRFDDVRRLARTFLFDVHDAVASVPGTTSARALIVRTAVEYLDRLAQESGGDPNLQRELASAYVRVGDAQGNPTSSNLGDTKSALASYQRAIAIAAGVLRSSPEDLDAARTLAMAHRRRADTLGWTGDLKTALESATVSDRLFAEIGVRAGSPLEDRVQAGIAQIKLGDVLGNPNFPNVGRSDEAAAHYGVALETFRRLDAAAPRNSRVRRYLGLTLERIGTLHESAKRWSEATAAYRESFDVRSSLATDQPTQTDILRDYAVAYEKLGNVQRSNGQLEAAVASYRNALAQFERLGHADSADANATRTIAISREKLAGAVDDLGSPDEASGLLMTALATHRQLAARDPSNAQARCDVARVAELFGDLVSRRRTTVTSKQLEDGCHAWQESLEMSAIGGSCATAADRKRLGDKLRSCRP